MTEINPTNKSRTTKIIATLGPATDSEQTIMELINAGVDVVRMNFSHGDSEDHLRRAQLLRKISKQKKYHVAILGDLQGPKIRIQRFVNDQIKLNAGQSFILDAQLDPNAGNENQVGVSYAALYKDVKKGDELLLDDGRITLEVEKSENYRVYTSVKVGGILSNNKGVNRRGGGLSAQTITDKDKEDIKIATQMGVDYLAVSFPKSPEDMIYAKKLLRQAGSNAALIAKIERSEALDCIDAILEVVDGVMVARGDLSIEIGDATLTAVQKQLINKARNHNCIAITATEMLQSMIDSNVPTRAEISDIANAVLDGSDALMLSAESAIGKHPALVVETMSRICQGAEQGDMIQHSSGYLLNQQVDKFDQAIALSATYTATHLNVSAIATMTESGSTSKWLSRLVSSIPIYALTHHIQTCRKVTLYRGVYPVLLKDNNPNDINQEVINALKPYHHFDKDSVIIITKGDKKRQLGGTNAMKIIRVNQEN